MGFYSLGNILAGMWSSEFKIQSIVYCDSEAITIPIQKKTLLK